MCTFCMNRASYERNTILVFTVARQSYHITYMRSYLTTLHLHIDARVQVCIFACGNERQRHLQIDGGGSYHRRVCHRREGRHYTR